MNKVGGVLYDTCVVVSCDARSRNSIKLVVDKKQKTKSLERKYTPIKHTLAT